MLDKDKHRIAILEQLCSGAITSPQASTILGVGTRQLRRLRKEFASTGALSVIHKNRGRTPGNKTPEPVGAQIRILCWSGGKYHDFNFSHTVEMLATKENIHVSRSTLTRILQ